MKSNGKDNKGNKNIFGDKKFRYGTYSTIMAVVVIAIMIAVNLVAGEFDYKLDLTSDSLFSLSDETKQVLDNADGDIKIYTLFSSKDSNTIISRVEQVLDQYKLANRSITIENKDLYLYPDFANKYASNAQSVDQNSIIVESGDRYKVIAYDDYSNNGQLNIEENVTAAIQYVTGESSSVVYFVTGHGEPDYSQYTYVAQQLKLNNYDIASINLLDSDIPDDCTMLFITEGTTDTRDYSADEAQKVKDYLTNDGRAVFMLANVDKEKYPNLCSVVSEYGLEPASGYILEGNEQHYLQYPVNVVPGVKEHEITKNIIDGGYTMLAYASQAINETLVKRQGIVIEPLLVTSEDSFIKSGDSASMNKEQGDAVGPFGVAYAVTYSTYTDTSHTTKVVVCGDFSVLDPAVDSVVNGSGSTFVVDAVKWLDEGSSAVTIKSKSINGDKLNIVEGDKTAIQLISWCIIPGVLFLCGFIVWIVRRNG
jgi:hypothetical protein